MAKTFRVDGALKGERGNAPAPTFAEARASSARIFSPGRSKRVLAGNVIKRGDPVKRRSGKAQRDALNRGLKSMESSLDVLEAGFKNLDADLGRLEASFESIEKRIIHAYSPAGAWYGLTPRGGKRILAETRRAYKIHSKRIPRCPKRVNPHANPTVRTAP